jgi:hypothetical protein
MGVRGDKRCHIRPLSPGGPLTKPLHPLPILVNEGERRGESQVTPPVRYLAGALWGDDSMICGPLGHMVSKRFARTGY